MRKKRGGRHDATQDFMEDGIPISTAIYCQQFFSRGLQCSFFQVTPQQEAEPTAGLLAEREEAGRVALSREALLHELVSTELDSNRKMLDASADVYKPIAADTEVDPWMEHTGYQQIFSGIPLLKAARLAHMPNPSIEPHLKVLTESLDRLVKAANAAVCDDRISVFDRFRINSFVNDDLRRASERELVVRLRKETYRAYKYTWKCLLCFVCRTSQGQGGDEAIQLPHQYTALQLTSIHKVLGLAETVSQGRSTEQERWIEYAYRCAYPCWTTVSAVASTKAVLWFSLLCSA